MGVKKFVTQLFLPGFLILRGLMVSGDYLYRHSCRQYDTAEMISLKITFTIVGCGLKLILLAIIPIVLM
ncbi:hypothetical protein ASV07_24045 [Enterobacter roggenkampii]|nr:hypothetical protein SS30_03735 [Enterobacter roggenkampii]KTI23434.1 hypothetical protein ASV07_24045 [Enterobacter roggenkampii]